MESMENTLCDTCYGYNSNGNDTCTTCIMEVANQDSINEDAWIDSALHAYCEGDGYGEWDAWQAQYDTADFDIYY